MVVQQIRNPTFVFLSLASCAEGIIVSGVGAFGAKFLQEKFNAPAAFAGFVMGAYTAHSKRLPPAYSVRVSATVG